MNSNQKRAQAPKKYDRHQSNIGDVRRMRTGPSPRGPRFDRNEHRNQSMRGEW